LNSEKLRKQGKARREKGGGKGRKEGRKMLSVFFEA